MLGKMSLITLVYVVVTFLLWKAVKDKQIGTGDRIAIGVLYGILSIFSTHCGVDYVDMVLNVRDLGPMAAGLFFDPVSGIIAGLIGGIERYIAGTYFGVGSFTRLACSISTCLAGFLAAFMRIFIFKDKKPSIAYAFFMGAVIEVFHMYVVFVTHRDDMAMAFHVVRICSMPMIIFSGIGLALMSLTIKVSMGEWYNPLTPLPKEEIPVSNRFQVWLFGVTLFVLLLNFGFYYAIQTQGATESAKEDLTVAAEDISHSFTWIRDHGGHTENFSHHVGRSGSFVIIDSSGEVLAGMQFDKFYGDGLRDWLKIHKPGEFYEAEINGSDSLCLREAIDDDTLLFVQLPVAEVYESRDMQAYETILGDILIFTVIYVLISMLVQNMVVDNLLRVNKSLNRITEGDLNEKVNVYNSSEFASLSDDINLTVDVLKGYIDAAEKRIEQELLLAHEIQDAALPKNFTFNHTGFEIYASMDPAREVGGDFYDFFFVEKDRIALVIADVAGKGIPAALFMMRSKTAIRSLAESGARPGEIFERVNSILCEANEISMFVTVWIGIVDLRTGDVECLNAGHEYPAIMRKGGNFELFRDKHLPPLGVMEGMVYTSYDMHLDPGDCLYVYTDGIPEANNTEAEQYGTSRMLSALNENKQRPVEEILNNVKTDIDRFTGEADQYDDITMIGFRYISRAEA